MDNERITEQINGLRSLLSDTDYVANKIVESLVETMQDATAVNFIAKFLAWLVSCTEEYGQTIRKRAQWREQIRELEQQREEVAQ